MYTDIFWDFDGTLFDTYPVMARAFQETLAGEYGISEKLCDILLDMKVSMTYTFNHYKEKYGVSDNFIKNFLQLSRKYEYNYAKPFDGVKDLCGAIYQNGMKNYLYTHRDKSALKMLQKFEIYNYFTDFVTSENGFEPKPSPQALNYFIEKHGIARKSALMAGDREIDIMSAKNAGIEACLFTENINIETKAGYKITDINDLYYILGLSKHQSAHP